MFDGVKNVFEKSKSIFQPESVEIKGLTIHKRDYVELSLITLYKRCIFDVLENLDGINIDIWLDNHTINKKGLASQLACAMGNQSAARFDIDGVDIYKHLTKVRGENARLEFDYSNFELTESLDTYLSMRFETLQALAKNNNISQSVLMKIDRLTEFQAAKESIEAIEAQLTQVTKGLEDGESVYIDKNSAIESVARDTSQFFATIESINTLIAGELGRPLIFVNGVGGSAMSDTGESDRETSARARERFYLEHIRPLLISIDINHKSLTLNIEIKNMSNVSTAAAIVDSSDCLTLADKQKILKGVGLSGNGVHEES